MTTTTADASMLGAAPLAPASEFRPDPEAPIAPVLRTVPETEPHSIPELQADRSLRFSEPQVEPVPEVQADPSLRFIAQPEPAEALEAAAPMTAAVARERRSWREQRAARRRRRLWLEEVLAWILVPVIVLGSYLFVDMVLGALGTSPAAILNGLSAIISAL